MQRPDEILFEYKKNYVWCATQLVKQYVVKYFIISHVETMNGTHHLTKRLMAAASQATCLLFFVKCWDAFQLLLVRINLTFNMRNEFVYWWKVCTTFGPKYWQYDVNQHNIDVLITVCKRFYISCATKSRRPRLQSFFLKLHIIIK